MARKNILVPFFMAIVLLYGIKGSDIPYDICEGVEFGYLSHPDPQRCTEYILCLHGDYHLFTCSIPGFIFYLPRRYCVRGNPETCEVFISVTTLSPTTTTTTESSIQITTTTLTHQSPTTTETTTSKIDDATTETTPVTEPEITTTTRLPFGPPELCENNTSRFVADPNHCYRYFMCLRGIAFPGQCEADKIFSQQWQGCIYGDQETCTPLRPRERKLL